MAQYDGEPNGLKFHPDGRILINGTLWRTVNTHATSTRYEELLKLPAFRRRTANLTLEVLSKGKPVDIDGLAVSQN